MVLGMGLEGEAKVDLIESYWRKRMLEELLYDEKFWIMILVVLFVVFIFGILFAMIAVILWLAFLWWNKYRIRIRPSDK